MPEFYQCVCPLWFDKQGKPDLVGSSTLIKVEQTRFLITAAHVIDSAMNNAMLVGSAKGFTQIGGRGKLTLASSGSRSSDRDDTSVIALDENTASFIEAAFVPLPIRYADVNDSFQHGKHYEFFGYPWRKVHAGGAGRILEPTLYKFKSGSIGENDYASLGLTTHKHIAVEFDLKQVTDETGRTVAAPNPEGMSGGPVWSFVPVQLDGQKMWSRRLAGIAIEYRSTTRTLIGVRINAALECIRMMFPNLSSSIPRNPKLAIICKDRSHE